MDREEWCSVCNLEIETEVNTTRCCNMPSHIRWNHFYETAASPEDWSRLRRSSNAVCLNCYEDFVLGP